MPDYSTYLSYLPKEKVDAYNKSGSRSFGEFIIVNKYTDKQ